MSGVISPTRSLVFPRLRVPPLRSWLPAPRLWIPRVLKMAGYPCCCQKEPECPYNAPVCSGAPGEFTVDLGVSWLTDADLACCDEVGGEYSCPRVTEPVLLYGTCAWVYVDQYCSDFGIPYYIKVSVFVLSYGVPPANTYAYEAALEIRQYSTSGSLMVYGRWDSAQSDDPDCLAGLEDEEHKIALTLQEKNIYLGVCGGFDNFPDTIYIWAA